MGRAGRERTRAPSSVKDPLKSSISLPEINKSWLARHAGVTSNRLETLQRQFEGASAAKLPLRPELRSDLYTRLDAEIERDNHLERQRRKRRLQARQQHVHLEQQQLAQRWSEARDAAAPTPSEPPEAEPPAPLAPPAAGSSSSLGPQSPVIAMEVELIEALSKQTVPLRPTRRAPPTPCTSPGCAA